MCSPKVHGGLGLREARNINQVAVMKVIWNLTANKNDLGVKLYRPNMGVVVTFVPVINNSKAGSNLWREVCSS